MFRPVCYLIVVFDWSCSSVAFLLCFCVSGFICDVCLVS